MRIAYLDCSGGISGESLLAAMIDAGADLAVIQNAAESLGQLCCRVSTSRGQLHEFRYHEVTIDGPSPAAVTLTEAVACIRTSRMTTAAQAVACRVLELISGAMGENSPTLEGVSGTLLNRDATTAVCCAVAWTFLKVDAAYCSPITTGTGHHPADGTREYSPTPTTACLLRQIPLSHSTTPGVLTDHVGAALARSLCSEFGIFPAMSMDVIGYGIRRRAESAQPIVSRIFLGNSDSIASQTDVVVMLETHLDDSTPEVIAYACERLMQAGALDYSTTPIHMKKGRLGIRLTVLAPPQLQSKLEQILFTETSTLGIRTQWLPRTILPRALETWDSPWGPIRVKVARIPGGGTRISPEFDDCRDIAIATGHSLQQIYQAAQQAYSTLQEGGGSWMDRPKSMG